MRRSTDVHPVTLMWDSRNRNWFRIEDDHGLAPEDLYRYGRQYTEFTDNLDDLGAIVAPGEIASFYQDAERVTELLAEVQHARQILDLKEALDRDLGPAGSAWDQASHDVEEWPARKMTRQHFVGLFLFDRQVRTDTEATLVQLYTRMLDRQVPARDPLRVRLETLARSLGVVILREMTNEELAQALSPPPQQQAPTRQKSAESATARRDRILIEYRTSLSNYLAFRFGRMSPPQQFAIEQLAAPASEGRYRVKYYSFTFNAQGEQVKTTAVDALFTLEELEAYAAAHRREMGR
jgi:hypothetical protein